MGTLSHLRHMAALKTHEQQQFLLEIIFSNVEKADGTTERSNERCQ